MPNKTIEEQQQRTINILQDKVKGLEQLQAHNRTSHNDNLHRLFLAETKLALREAKTKGDALEIIAIMANEDKLQNNEEEFFQDYVAEVWG